MSWAPTWRATSVTLFPKMRSWLSAVAYRFAASSANAGPFGPGLVPVLEGLREDVLAGDERREHLGVQGALEAEGVEDRDEVPALGGGLGHAGDEGVDRGGGVGVEEPSEVLHGHAGGGRPRFEVPRLRCAVELREEPRHHPGAELGLHADRREGVRQGEHVGLGEPDQAAAAGHAGRHLEDLGLGRRALVAEVDQRRTEAFDLVRLGAHDVHEPGEAGGCVVRGEVRGDAEGDHRLGEAGDVACRDAELSGGLGDGRDLRPRRRKPAGHVEEVGLKPLELLGGAVHRLRHPGPRGLPGDGLTDRETESDGEGTQPEGDGATEGLPAVLGPLGPPGRPG
jgi:hypothetical protein